MPSPFPGMDPYLESPGIWPDFHNRFAEHISSVLNDSLPNPYYAQLESRSEIGLGGESRQRVIVPDVNVQRSSEAPPRSVAGAALAEPRSEISSAFEVVIENDSVELSSVEIRDAEANHAVVTLIELLSPSDKRRGPDRDRLLTKRSRVLRSATSLIEIDLLRSGIRAWNDPAIDGGSLSIDTPGEYFVVISRAWQRLPDFRLLVFPIGLREMLPVIAVPLREKEAEIPLDLQFCFRRAYDSGPYRRGRINYAQPATPELSAEHQSWAAVRIAAWHAAR